ncbi:MAG: hypothetical protein ACP5LE_02275, partial [Thermoplasmata archaeon]
MGCIIFSGIIVLIPATKTDLKIYKCAVVGDEGELSEQGVEISVIVINYGGMPATGSIKLISLWNKTPVVIAECNRIEGFGNWNVKTHIDFAPASVFLEYEGKV